MNKKTFRKAFKSMIDNKTISEQQENYLKNLYADEDSIIGIHKTGTFESIFENGLHNYTSMDKASNDLSNTVMYSDLLPVLISYSSGANNDERYPTSIILKIPKKVFNKEQGIFETLKDNTHGIPSEFIACAFENGKIIENPLYNKEYISDKAQLCEDSIAFQNKKELINLYDECKRGSLFNQIMNKIKNVLNKNNTKLLSENIDKYDIPLNIKDELSNKVNNDIQINDSQIKNIDKEEKDIDIEKDI